MKKQNIIEVFKVGYEEFMGLVKRLSDEQIESVPVVGEWTTKEIIAHLAAWNWEQAREIARVLKCKPTWNNPKYDTYNDDKFNKIQVEKRKGKSAKELLNELEKSFDHLIARIESLDSKEWNHRCKNQYWDDGKEMTIQSLFTYEFEGSSDTSRHAEEVKKRFNL